ncbi:response regulator transcription factor [Paramicrobacterium agarici]|uniref:LuxR family two component transcriptional regulator n=1 Tax=Paramicrobacterium agarici TaxID=630514 RepID=A0A2A9DVC0_9MICO|nr:response regulator transcription factor [Microbacterium agarici]PFG30291.1 LuxR family two component transcriptional regulator [Microbacterium agarici]
MISIVIAEDQTMMRSALTSLLELEDDLTVCAGVSRGDDVAAAVREHKPDVALVDIEMPGKSGLDAIADIRRESPGTAVVIVTTFGRAGYLRRAMDAGARGFLVKDNPVEELAASIRRVVAGETVIDQLLAAQALSAGENPLSDREVDVLAASDGGIPISEIAQKLHLSTATVRNYLSAAIGKLGARNRAEALTLARRSGWV